MMAKYNNRIMEIFSPSGLCLFSFLIALISWIIPSLTYKNIVGEKDYYSLDLVSMAWVVLCSLSYFIGILVFISLRIKISTRNEIYYRSSIITLVPYIIVTTLGYIFLLIKGLGGYQQYISVMTNFGSDYNRLLVYNALQTLNIGWIPQLLFPFIAYLSFLIFSNKNSAKQKIIIASAIFFYLCAIFPSQTKASIISFFVIFVFGYFYALNKENRLNVIKSIVTLSALIVLSLTFFVAAQSVKQGRDFSSASGVLKELVGYGPASFNRLAAVLHDELSLPNRDIGYYTNTWYWDSPGKSFIDKNLENIGFDIPQPGFENWLATFKAVKDAKLNDNFIWVTSYGESFVDYKYWGLIWFILYGFASQMAWSLVKVSEKYILIYSVFLISGFQWYATASIGNKSLLFAVIGLAVIEIVRKYKNIYRKYPLEVKK